MIDIFLIGLAHGLLGLNAYIKYKEREKKKSESQKPIRKRSDKMGFPYYFWLAKYNITGLKKLSERFSIEDIIKYFSFPDFNKIGTVMQEANHLFNLMKLNLEDYESTKNDIYLQEIQEITRQLVPVLNEAYKELEFFNTLSPITEEQFLEVGAENMVAKSPLFIGLKCLVDAEFEGTMSEDILLGELDKLRDVIYDIRDGELAKVLEKTKKPSEFFPSVSDNLFEKGLNNLEEALKIIEKSFQEKDSEAAGEGLLKARRGLIDLKIVEIVANAVGG